MSRYRAKNKSSSFGGNVLLLITIIIVIGIVNGCNIIKGYIVSNKEYNEIKKEFNEEEFNTKLIPRENLVNLLKEEYPNIELVNSTVYGYSNPSKIEEYEIITGVHENGNTVSVGIQIWTYSKEKNYLFSNDKDVEFSEIDGKLEQINIIASSSDFPFDGDFMKKLLINVSKGIGKELTVEEVTGHIDTFLIETKPFVNAINNGTGRAGLSSGYGFNNNGIDYHFSISPPGRFHVEGVYIYGINVNILGQEDAEKAFKVMYEIKD
ncbi:hypothetical protein [Bacillus sp. FJAT-29937]|uniref:hypothetical protein n=1 Tax=Bacillus sp. FJAT-29937 TaxID=1720553 RepID=UPI00083144BA|nr:hypothetical protein [Bacillus sp. FJAT-29937]